MDVYTRVDVDKVYVENYGAMSFLRFSWQGTREEPSTFFAPTNELNDALASKDFTDPVDALVTLRQFHVVAENAPDIFGTVPFEELFRYTGEHKFDDLFVDDEEACSLDPQELWSRSIFVDYRDHSIWRPGNDVPSSRVYTLDTSAGLTSDRFDLETAEKILADHPWVVGLKRERARHFYDGDIPAGIAFDVLLPDEVFSLLWYSQAAGKPGEPRYISSSGLKEKLVCSLWYEHLTPVEGVGPDPLGLLPALLPEIDWED